MTSIGRWARDRERTVGVAVGIGASLSTAGAGYVADAAGTGVVFLCLTGVAVSGLLLMPETGKPGSP